MILIDKTVFVSSSTNIGTSKIKVMERSIN